MYRTSSNTWKTFLWYNDSVVTAWRVVGYAIKPHLSVKFDFKDGNSSREEQIPTREDNSSHPMKEFMERIVNAMTMQTTCLLEFDFIGDSK